MMDDVTWEVMFAAAAGLCGGHTYDPVARCHNGRYRTEAAINSALMAALLLASPPCQVLLIRDLKVDVTSETGDSKQNAVCLEGIAYDP